MDTLYIETSIVSYLRQRPSSQVIMAARQLLTLDGIPLLPLDPEIAQIADEIMTRAILPPKARTDALHIAMVAHHRIQFLLTWNCRHLANATILPRLHKMLNDVSIPIPIICTPEEMVHDDQETDD